ncbi:Ig-like domain-containing protein [Saccharospirillum salsuginis]|uniref:SbsA Ig-like domain-containing protein n=1 Tax=Saccharospirillum salsuginis TaxID=418750 RepID=A0A918N8W5_9GAMM|nr:Ig-like domain-containing protein [Saccharospirillum salsuginis]GGX52135.1 hypothetical protein GCM10007392_19330 [Saccharospirillum salsuginis]
MRIITLLLLSVLLSACDTGITPPNADFSSWEKASLIDSYPYDGQTEVPVNAPVALRFSHQAWPAEPDESVTFETANGEAVAFTTRSIAGGQGLVVQPDSPLAPATTYRIQLAPMDTEKGALRLPRNGIRFTTGTRTRGAEEATRTESEFRVSRLIPDGESLPMLDFSTLRLQFTQPLDRDSLVYGENLTLKDSDGRLVKAHIVQKGRYLTLDPREDLNAGSQYTLSVGSGLRSVSGRSLNPGEFAEFTLEPQTTTPRETLVQQAQASNASTDDACGPDLEGDQLSPLFGQPINCVPMVARLLGDASSSQQSGDLHVELAYPPRFPEVTPFRVPRGTRLTGSSVDVMIGGVTPAGYSSGPLEVLFVTDAVGYLMPNGYSDHPSAPKRVRMFMDVAMTADSAQANGGLSQDLLHLELVGSAIVRDGVMELDALGIVAPRVLGIDQGYGIVPFHMTSYRDQTEAPSPVRDTEAPELQSWMPGQTDAGDMRPGDPIVVNLSEPVDRDSLARDGAIDLVRDGVSVAFDWRLDGGTLVVQPRVPLAHGNHYQLHLNHRITDLAGNPLADDYSLDFTLPHHIGGADRAPVVTTVYPGYGCVTVDRDLANNDHGRCQGGQASDDHLPVTELPADRPIVVQFSQTMDPNSVELDGSFTVARNSRTDGQGTWNTVAGRLETGARILRFHPEQAWESGVLYRYTLGSNGDPFSSEAQCDGSDALCSLRPDGSIGYPLQTRMLAQSPDEAPIATGGGPDLTVYFRGGAPADGVLQTFRNLPTLDVNANFIHDGRGVDDDQNGCMAANCEALPEHDDEGQVVLEENSTRINAVGAGGLASNANTGCGFEGGEPMDCPERQHVWLTAGLNSEVMGIDSFPGTGKEAVKVRVFPNIIITSNLDVYAQMLGLPVHNASGPQIMRVRYDRGPDGELQPLTGWIYETENGPYFQVDVTIYLDAPYLSPPLGLSHNLHSYEAGFTLQGPVNFLDDGRMQVQLKNTEPVPVNVSVGSGTIKLDLHMPAQGIFLNFTALPIKQ